MRDVIALPGPKHGEPITANLAPGVAVIADNTWAALQGQRALKIEWTPGPYATESSAALDAQCAQLFKGTGARARNDGDFDAARAAAAQVVEATYRVPFVSHAPLEPQNACVDVRKDSVLIVAPLQMPGGASRIAAQLTGVDRLKIEVRMTRVGGGFGRRLTNDFIAEAVMLSKRVGKPIKLLWTREEDMRHDFYRPFGQHHLIATLDADRQDHRLGASARERVEVLSPPRCEARGPVDLRALSGRLPRAAARATSAWNGSRSTPASCAAHGARPRTRRTPSPCRVSSTRSHTPRNRIRSPCASACSARRARLPYGQHGGPTFNPGRLADVLRLAAQRIGWGRSVPRGRGLGIAGHFTFGGYAAHAMEVSVAGDGSYRIERCVCAVDVGRPINRLGLEAQMMGGTIDGISTARNLEISIKEGQVVQSNFNDYPLLRIADAPDVEVAIVDSERDPSGAGEIGLPTAAPALANAIFAASGHRVRNLPIGARLGTARES